MNSSTSILSTAVVAAVLGSASLAVQAQAGTAGGAADIPGREAAGGTTYPTPGGAAVGGSTYGSGTAAPNLTPPGQSGVDAAGMPGTDTVPNPVSPVTEPRIGTDLGAGMPAGESGVLEDERGVLENDSGVLENDSGVLENDSGVLQDEGGVIEEEGGIVGEEPEVGADASGVPGYQSGTVGYGGGPSSSGMPATTGTSGTSATDRAGALGAGSSYGAGYGTSGRDAAGMGSSRSSMGATGMGTDAAGVAGGMTGQSWLPYTTNGYVGGSLGMADFGDVCLGCDDPDWSGKVYTGGMLNPWSGVEASWIWFGEGDRAGGGDVSAHGLNLSYILSFPVSQGFNVFGRLGGTYGWTDVSGGAPGAPSGDDNGFGLAYGVGASMDLAPNWAVRLEWERHRLKFAGNREGVDLATIGVSYKF